MKKGIEILAPAGNFDSLKCAIYNGADAVYLGYNNFSARGNIENFNLETLKEAIKFAHIFDVKVYLTLNTLIKDSEFEDVTEFVKNASLAGVDAFIVQDIGLSYYLRKNFPNIELHASTQMGIQNLEGLQSLKDINFKRVVLARETPLSEIKRIKENSDIEIEYFIQGALCVAFSGNCYLCSLLANSSGNRGKCKQFCRLEYKLTDKNVNKQGYLLSTKDFCMLPMLKQLADSGVSSFKIEGRARRPAYIAVATSIYQNAAKNNFEYNEEDLENLKKVYNRGNFIKGYLSNENIIYSSSQNHIGIKIGEIIGVIKGKKFNEVKIKSSHELVRGDVIKIFKNGKELCVISIVDVQKQKDNVYKITTTSNVEIESDVNLIVDSKLEEKYIENKKYILVDCNFTANEGERAKIELKSSNVSITLESDFVVEHAKTKPLNYEDCKSQFSKMGDIFKLNKLSCSLTNAFILKSQLNELRRKALKLLEGKIIKIYNEKNKIEEKSNYKKFDFNLKNTENIKKNIIIFENFAQIDNNLKNNILIYKIYDFDENQILKDYQKYKELNVYISLPILATFEELNKIKSILSKCSNWGVVANNYYTLNLTSKDKTIIGNNMNVYNSYAVKYYSDKGYKNIILSIEIEDLDVIRASSANLFVLSDYYPEYMYFRHCPFKEHFNSSCNKCKYKTDVIYNLNNKKFILKRQKIISCQFILKSTEKQSREVNKNFNSAIEL